MNAEFIQHLRRVLDSTAVDAHKLIVLDRMIGNALNNTQAIKVTRGGTEVKANTVGGWTCMSDGDFSLLLQNGDVLARFCSEENCPSCEENGEGHNRYTVGEEPPVCEHPGCHAPATHNNRGERVASDTDVPSDTDSEGMDP